MLYMRFAVWSNSRTDILLFYLAADEKDDRKRGGKVPHWPSTITFIPTNRCPIDSFVRAQWWRHGASRKGCLCLKKGLCFFSALLVIRLNLRMHNDRNRSKRAYLEEKFGLWRLFEICVKFRLSVFKNHLYCVSIMPMGHNVWFEIASLCSFTTRPAKGHQPPKKYRQTRLFQAGLRLFFFAPTW